MPKIMLPVKWFFFFFRARLALVTFSKCQPDLKSCTSDLSFKMVLLVLRSWRACYPVDVEGALAECG